MSMSKQEVIVFSSFFVFVILPLIGIPVARYISKDTVQIEVEEKYTKIQENSNHYMVNTEHETLVNIDRFIFFKFNSSDVQRELQKGLCYEVVVEGWRVPFLSWYKNILTIEKEIPCSE